MSKAGCGYVPGSALQLCTQVKTEFREFCLSQVAENHNRCLSHIAWVSSRLASEVKPGDVVSVSNSALAFLDLPALPAYLQWLESLQETVVHRGGSLVLFGFTPILPSPGVSCMPTYLDPSAPLRCQVLRSSGSKDMKNLKDKSVQVCTERAEHVVEMYTNLTKSKSRTHFFNHHDLFCDAHECGAFVPGSRTLAFYDTSHLTEAGSHYLAPYVCDFFHSHNLFPK